MEFFETNSDKTTCQGHYRSIDKEDQFLSQALFSAITFSPANYAEIMAYARSVQSPQRNLGTIPMSTTYYVLLFIHGIIH